MSREHTFLQSHDLAGRTVYDIGGHIGLMTLFFARKTGKSGQVISFEPNPQNYQAIVDHVSLNGFTNVRVLQVGLGRQRETLEFVVATDASARGSFDAGRRRQLVGQRGVTHLEVEVDSLDGQIAKYDLPRPDFVKIDVEGLELDVLHGMVKTINECRPQMLIELHGVREREVVDLLLSHGYKIYQVEDGIEIARQNLERVHGHLYVHFGGASANPLAPA